MIPDEEIVEQFILEAFEENFELLQLEGGHSLAANVKAAALNQVLLYWRKLHDIAMSVTETEVKLSLPNQETPQGRKFNIDGVVDIVQEEGRTFMYDIKTHDADYINSHPELYTRQLNVYAHIWQSLREKHLDGTAIIATAFPEYVRAALDEPDPRALEAALRRWNPVIPLQTDPAQVEETIRDFACVVDAIEGHQFAPPPLEKLNDRLAGDKVLFATRVCRNCDSRFSCDSYREYALHSRQPGTSQIMQYFSDFGTDQELEDWLNGALENNRQITE